MEIKGNAKRTKRSGVLYADLNDYGYVKRRKKSKKKLGGDTPTERTGAFSFYSVEPSLTVSFSRRDP